MSWFRNRTQPEDTMVPMVWGSVVLRKGPATQRDAVVEMHPGCPTVVAGPEKHRAPQPQDRAGRRRHDRGTQLILPD